MAQEMKGMSTATLRHVPESQIRDGSIPLTHQVIEHADKDWVDESHVPDALPELAHINHPREGEVINGTFNLHYVDPNIQTVTQKFRLLFKPVPGPSKDDSVMSANEVDDRLHHMDLETFGNQYKGTIQRPAGLSTTGAYSRPRPATRYSKVSMY